MPDKWAQYAQPTTAVQPSDVQKQPGDKWAQYAQPAEAAADPPAVASKPAAAKPKQGLTDENGPIAGPLRSIGRSALSMIGMKPGPNGDYGFNDVPTDGSQTYGSKLGAQLHNLGNHAVRTLAAPILHPVDTLQSFQPQSTAESVLGPGAVALRQIGQAGKGMYEDYKQHGIGAAGGDALGMYLSGKAADAVAGVPGGLKRIVTGDVNAPIAGADFSPAERYEAAKRVGVQLPPAQAVNSPILRGLDKFNREGLLSAPMHEELAAKNAGALSDATDATLQRLSPHDPETGGRIVQDKLKQPFVDLQNRANDTMTQLSPLGKEQGGSRLQSLLKNDQKSLQDSSSALQQDTRDEYGNLPIQSYHPMRSTARTILEQNAPVEALTPNLAPKQVRSIIRDISKMGVPGEDGQVPAHPTIGNLMDIRSRLLDVNANNPELVRGAAEADIDRQVGATHQTIEDSLPPEGLGNWLKGNEIWKDMKGTYDNPSSPFYHAVRTPTPSTLTEGIGSPTPEGVRGLRKRVGDEGVGIVGRGVGEKLLGRTGTGEYDLKNFGARLERTPEEYRNELFGNGPHEQLQKIGGDYRELQPFEKGAYTSNPEELTHGIGPETAAGVRQLREIPVKPQGAVGPNAPRIGEEGMGAVRRGVATDLLGKTATSGYNFPTFAGKLARMNEGYRNELFGPEHQTLKDIGMTSNALDTDYNRSGSGKLTQKILEGTALASGLVHPLAAIEPLAQFPLGKIMTSPRVSDFLMKPSSRPSPAVGVAAGAAVAPKRKLKKEN